MASEIPRLGDNLENDEDSASQELVKKLTYKFLNQAIVHVKDSPGLVAEFGLRTKNNTYRSSKCSQCHFAYSSNPPNLALISVARPRKRMKRILRRIKRLNVNGLSEWEKGIVKRFNTKQSLGLRLAITCPVCKFNNIEQIPNSQRLPDTNPVAKESSKKKRNKNKKKGMNDFEKAGLIMPPEYQESGRVEDKSGLPDLRGKIADDLNPKLPEKSVLAVKKTKKKYLVNLDEFDDDNDPDYNPLSKFLNALKK